MPIDQLIKICPPPPNLEHTNHPWDEIIRDIGRPLPADYIDLCNTYGCGKFDDFICAFFPFSRNRYLNLSKQIQARLEANHQYGIMCGESCPYNADYKSGGLLPLAATDNGDVVYWYDLKEDPPARIILAGSRDHWEEWEEHETDLTGFLADALSGRLITEIFPDDFPSASPKFVPFIEEKDRKSI